MKIASLALAMTEAFCLKDVIARATFARPSWIVCKTGQGSDLNSPSDCFVAPSGLLAMTGRLDRNDGKRPPIGSP